MSFCTCGSMTTFVMILINTSSSCVTGFKKDLITFFNFTMFFSYLVQTANNRSWCMLHDVVGVCHLVCIFSEYAELWSYQEKSFTSSVIPCYSNKRLMTFMVRLMCAEHDLPQWRRMESYSY